MFQSVSDALVRRPRRAQDTALLGEMCRYHPSCYGSLFQFQKTSLDLKSRCGLEACGILSFTDGSLCALRWSVRLFKHQSGASGQPAHLVPSITRVALGPAAHRIALGCFCPSPLTRIWLVSVIHKWVYDIKKSTSGSELGGLGSCRFLICGIC